MKKLGLLTLLLLLLETGLTGMSTVAKTAPSVNFLPNPLESKAADPLLPNPDRPLTPAERDRLTLALDELNLKATAQFTAGDPVGAFDLWNRELRLRRALGPMAEVTALGRVGAIAWQQNNGSQTRWITQRLDHIAAPLAPRAGVSGNVPAPASPPADADLLNALGWAYQQVRSPAPAIAIYQQLLASARQRHDAVQETSVLQTLGQLHLDWFQYPQAADIYQQLLAQAKAQSDLPSTPSPRPPVRRLPTSPAASPAAPATTPVLPSGLPGGLPNARSAVSPAPAPNPAPDPVTDPTLNPVNPAPANFPPAIQAQIFYLTQLAYIHEKAKQPAQAIPYQQQLITLYAAQQFPDPIPKLQIKIADNYARLGQLAPAETHYQTAYQVAQSLVQLGNASESLQKLGDLYRQNNRLDAALRIYDALVGVDFQSYNYYGMMNAYDQIGQIHRQRRNYDGAIAAFQHGLELAKRLQYREAYFNTQIQTANQPSPPSPPKP